jgi:hypothetical protein
MTERYCPNCGDKLDNFTAQHEHDIVCRWRYAVERGKLAMEQSNVRIRQLMALEDVAMARITELESTLTRIATHECMCCSGDCCCGFLFQGWARAAIKTQQNYSKPSAS